MNAKILLVEDDVTLSMIVSDTLRRNGFEVQTAADGEEGLRRFTRDGADLIVADVMMPRLDGFEMGRRIRRIDRNVPLLFLTAKAEIDDIVKGFELGCNDYLKKPFKMLELIVRVKALLRRTENEKEETALKVGKYVLNMNTQQLSFANRNPVTLTLIEAKLLRELVVNIGHTVEASSLMLLIWQRDDPYSRNSLHGFVHKLRHYLRHDASISILNQRGIGYKLTMAEE